MILTNALTVAITVTKNVSTVQLLVRFISCNSKYIQGRSPLHFAVTEIAQGRDHYSYDPRVIIYPMIRKGADFTQLDSSGWTPLHIAAMAPGYAGCELFKDILSVTKGDFLKTMQTRVLLLSVGKRVSIDEIDFVRYKETF